MDKNDDLPPMQMKRNDYCIIIVSADIKATLLEIAN
jgi:hypothetical protein